MKSRILPALTVVFIFVASAPLAAVDAFSCGSTGALGPINVASGSSTITLPEDGIIHATTVTVAAGSTLFFSKNTRNTPVYLLATGDVTIAGTVSVSAKGTGSGGAGNGGFDGGVGDNLGAYPSAGIGPGAGQGNSASSGCGHGGFGTVGGGSTPNGMTYGSALLMPLVGGSGGGASGTSNGGGGGGAIQICSPTRIALTGTVAAAGWTGGTPCDGSGGAIRVVAPRLEGTGSLNTSGASSGAVAIGRSRVDTIDRSALAWGYVNTLLSQGTFMKAFADVIPRLDIIEVAGNAIAIGSGPVQYELPPGASTTQDVVVRGLDFTGLVPIRVVVTPDRGDPVAYDASIDMSGGNPSQVTVTVTIPENNPVRINAWTR